LALSIRNSAGVDKAESEKLQKVTKFHVLHSSVFLITIISSAVSRVQDLESYTYYVDALLQKKAFLEQFGGDSGNANRSTLFFKQ
jgi:hypothetical protein